MKRIILIGILSGLILSSFAEKGWIVTQKMEDANSKGQNVTVTWYVSETHCKAKMEFSDGKVNSVSWLLADAPNNRLLMYNEGPVPAGAQKAYFPVPVQNIKADKSMDASRVTVSRSGETKIISGMLCEKVMMKTNNTITEMWVSKTFKAEYYKFYPFFRNSYELMGLSEEKIQGVPFESVTKDISGKVINSYQLISARSSEFTEKDFIVPAEYKNIEDLTKE